MGFTELFFLPSSFGRSGLCLSRNRCGPGRTGLTWGLLCRPSLPLLLSFDPKAFWFVCSVVGLHHTHKKKRNKAAQKEENRSSFFSRGIQSKTGIKRERKGRRRHQNRNQTIPFNGRIERNDSEMRPRKKKTLDRERRKRRPNRKAGAIFYWSRHFSFNSANEMLVLTEEEEEQEKKKDKKRNRERERDTLKTYPRHHTHTYTHTHAGRFTRRAERGHSKAHLIKTRAVSSAWIWQSIFRFFSVFLFVGGGGGECTVSSEWVERGLSWRGIKSGRWSSITRIVWISEVGSDWNSGRHNRICRAARTDHVIYANPIDKPMRLSKLPGLNIAGRITLTCNRYDAIQILKTKLLLISADYNQARNWIYEFSVRS